MEFEESPLKDSPNAMLQNDDDCLARDSECDLNDSAVMSDISPDVGSIHGENSSRSAKSIEVNRVRSMLG
jgi:hypothetical protein